MVKENISERLKQEIKKNIPLLIGLVIVFSVGLMGEKIYFSPVVIETGAVHSEKTIQVLENQENTKDAIQTNGYADLLLTYSDLNEFLKQTETKFDYAKFDQNWNYLDQEEKLKWLQKHMSINRYFKENYQFIFLLDKNIPKDWEYSKENAPALLNSYINFSKTKIREINPQSSFRDGESVNLVSKQSNISQHTIIAKYGTIGGVLGLLIGMVIITVKLMRNSKNE